MDVSVDGASLYRWPVSTGRRGFGTPAGTFRPQRMAARWFSTVYDNAPMPHAIFFHGGFAIHGSYDIARLGGPASHGCIRLHPSAAEGEDEEQRERPDRAAHGRWVVVPRFRSTKIDATPSA